MAQLVHCTIAHTRVRPQRNAFRYSMCYFAIPLSEWKPGRLGGLLSIDQTNIYSLRSVDYGDGREHPSQWIRGVLAANGLVEADGEAVLLTLPRLLGFAFNPVSFWFCLDKSSKLRVVLAEVNNTFGERHSYLCFRIDHGPIRSDEQLHVRKVFHVSPFNEVCGSYRFRFAFEANRIAVAIDLHDEAGLLLSTSIGGRRAALTVTGQWHSLISYPLQTLRLVVSIHYQAAKLYLKGMRNYRKPVPPTVPITH